MAEPKTRKRKKPKLRLTPYQQARLDLDAGRITASTFSRLRSRIFNHACSYAWAEDVWNGIPHHHLSDKPNDVIPYPPPANSPDCQMIRCSECKRDTPPQCVQNWICDDCRYAQTAPEDNPDKMEWL